VCNTPRSSLLSRSGFLGAVSAAALPLFAEPARALAQAQEAAGTEGPVLVTPLGLSAANRRAADIASNSPFVKVLTAQALSLAQSIGDAKLRNATMTMLIDPRPSYMHKYRDIHSRVDLRDRLARAGFVAADAPVEGIFPTISDTGSAQPFWSAPGSETTGHHAYPGGLCVHEIFNARIGAKYAQTYDEQYFGGASAVNGDLTIAAAFYHDIMKATVFQYREDGTFTDELTIAGTGAHHTLSGAEAIARGEDPRFVVILLSAHAAPSLGDEAKVVAWCRASAMIAGVDPVAYGMLKVTTDGYALAFPPPIEAFVSHLSDHDYVLSIHAAQAVRPMLATIASQCGVDPTNTTALNWWRLQVTSAASEIALYHELTKGESAFLAAVKRATV
jgi:hypothetical protein